MACLRIVLLTAAWLASGHSMPVAVNSTVSTLQRLVLIHRHGDRAPTNPYPLDPYQGEVYWPGGVGQLTKVGKQRMYTIGQYMASRYRDFLSHSPRQVYARSSNQDRCLESIQLVLAGMFPPNAKWSWNKELGSVWQPFPIQTVPKEYDSLLRLSSKCNRADQEMAQIFKHGEGKKFDERNMAFYLEIQNYTGIPDSQLNVRDVSDVYDTLISQQSNGLPFPCWVTENIYSRLENILDYAFYARSVSKVLQRLRSGMMFKELVSIFFDSSNETRVNIYATHDDFISTFLSALGVYNGITPGFGSTVILELHSPDRGGRIQKPYVRALYYNDSRLAEPYLLKLTKCSQNAPCTVDKFYEMAQQFIPDDWNKECEN